MINHIYVTHISVLYTISKLSLKVWIQQYIITNKLVNVNYCVLIWYLHEFIDDHVTIYDC